MTYEEVCTTITLSTLCICAVLIVYGIFIKTQNHE